jgi:hypothetical protein
MTPTATLCCRPEAGKGSLSALIVECDLYLSYNILVPLLKLKLHIMM